VRTVTHTSTHKGAPPMSQRPTFSAIDGISSHRKDLSARLYSHAEEVYAMPSPINMISRCCARNATLLAMCRTLSKPLPQRLLGFRSPKAAKRHVCANVTLRSVVDFALGTCTSPTVLARSPLRCVLPILLIQACCPHALVDIRPP